VAYNMKLHGKSLDEIKEACGYVDDNSVYQALTQRFEREAQMTPSKDRQRLLDLENARIELLLSAVMPSAAFGDPLAVRNATALIALQAKINQLEAVDTQVGQRTVLVIGGAQADYVARLKEMTEDD
jgi:hypothetical protein